MSLADIARFGLVHARTVGRSMARPMCESIQPSSRMGNRLPTFVGSFEDGPTSRSDRSILHVDRAR